ncbi:MAG: hypothetical protein HDQ98_00135 [Lachnospiraceae bacterium]|nr:hypothetical protein [Lachnospiraceae bacterium]
MEAYKAAFDGILTVLKHPVVIGNVKFSLFGLMCVSLGAYFVSIVLKAIFGDD